MSVEQADMMTKHLQESSPKQAPVADNTNGAPLRFQHQCSHSCRMQHQPTPADPVPPVGSPAGHHHGNGEAAVGPLVLTPGSATVCRVHCCGTMPAPPSGMISALRDSRYLRPAQELLREAVSVGEVASACFGGSEDAAKKHGQFEAGDSHQGMCDCLFHDKNNDGGVQAKLLSLLSELESRQEHYFQELNRVASSFEPALGLAGTAGYTSVMAQAMARHFGNLRRAILRKLRLLVARRPAPMLRYDESDEEEEEEDDAALPITEDMVSRLVQRKKQAAAVRAEKAWRPLRGLPEDSVAVLRAWLFDHFLDPYPNDNEKLSLAVSTGLSRRQISNWFINARVRLWKPMVEEMYNDEFSDDSVSRDEYDTSGGASPSS